MKHIRILLIFIVLSVWISFPLVYNLNLIGIQDWDYALGHGLLQQISITKYFQIPLWNPYYCGGMSNIGNPQTDFLYPLFLPIIFFGPVLGYRIVFFLMCLIGLLGSYLLGRYLKLSKTASILVGFIYFGSGIFSVPFTGGMSTYLTTAFLPYIFLFLLYAFQRNVLYIFGASLSLTMMYFGGFHYILIILLSILIFGLVSSICYKSKKPLILSLISVIIFLGLSAIKIIPVTQTATSYKREVNEPTSGYTIQSLMFSLLSTDQSFETHDSITPSEVSFLYGRTSTTAEESMYIGYLCLTLFFIGIFTRNKRKLTFFFTFIILFWIMMGTQIPFALYEIIRSLPFFEYMRVAQRYRYPAMIFFSIFIGYGLDRLFNFIKKYIHNKKILNAIYIIILGIIILDVSRVNVPILISAFQLSTPQIKTSNNFKQLCTNTEYYSNLGISDQASLRSSWHTVYPYILANYGIPYTCNEPLPVKSSAQCSNYEPYLGEYYLLPYTGFVNQIMWSPNRLVYNVELENNSVLVINQNFDNGWKAKVDGINSTVSSSTNGLIEVNLPMESHKVELYYLPTTFIFGAYISILTLLVLFGTLFIDLLFKKFRKKNPL